MEKDTLQSIVIEIYNLAEDDYRGNNMETMRELIKEIVARSQMDKQYVDSILEG